MKYNIPDNYEKFVLYENERERLNRLSLKQYYEELEETDDTYYKENER